LLFKRHNIYYCRIWIPLGFRQYFHGRSEIKRSLKTEDHQAAKTAAAALSHSIESLITGIRLGMLNEDDIKRIRSKIIGEATEDIHSKINYFGNDPIPLAEYGSRWLRYEWTPDKVLDSLKSPEKLDSGFINDVRAMALNVEKKLRDNRLHPSITVRARNAVNDLQLDINAPLLDYSSPEDITLPDARISPHFVDVCTIVAKAAVEVVLLEYGKLLELPNDDYTQRVSRRYREGLPVARLKELWDSHFQDKTTRGKWSGGTAEKY
jgi:hypothetical protein